MILNPLLEVDRVFEGDFSLFIFIYTPIPIYSKKFKFTENFFFDQASKVRAATQLPLAYLGGISSLSGIEKVIKAGFDFVTIGRALIHNPNFIQDLKSGNTTETPCTRCNECVVEMDRGGVRCTL